MFDVFYFGPKPGLFEFERAADNLEHAAELSRTRFYWYIYGGNDYTNFDFDFKPPKWEESHVHVFPSQWQQDGGVYLANKYTVSQHNWNWRTEQQVTRSLVNKEKWIIPEYIDSTKFDFSWHPNPHESDYEYHFGTQWQSAGGPIYKGTAGIKLINSQRAVAMPTVRQWNVAEEVDSSVIDFSWHPNPLDPPFVYHFASEYQKSSGLIYTVAGATEIKLIDDIPIIGSQSAIKVLDIFFVDRNNSSAAKRFEKLQQQHPTIQKIRYANSMIETVKRCATRSNTSKFWVISSENVYDDFDFAWHAEPWQNYMTHIFGSQWQKWSDTYLINKCEFERNSKWATGLEEFPNLNFVKDQQVCRPDDVYDIYYVDHVNPASQDQFKRIKQRYPNIKTARYVDNYLDTFKRIMTTANTEYVWIINSICDYSRFDFTWQPEPWQAEMLHVFPSSNQKFGDTFYIHVPSFKKQMDQLEILDWFEVVNYCNDQSVSRLPIDAVHYTEDSLASAVKQHQFTGPYAVFTNTGEVPDYTPTIWRKKDRALHTFTSSGAISIVPRDVQADLGKQMYDYPYILKHKDSFLSEQGLDIIYISNGEKDEQRWYDHTCTATKSNVKWVRGINGRTAAYQAAACASNTPWFLTVFAKLEVNPDFPWTTWQPDYLQEPKHYIFNARNVLNGLEYGHMGVIAYNKKLVLENNAPGLDFTLSQAHESVPLLSATAHYNADPWMTWRTAFREVLKLKYFMHSQPTLETEYRLQVWMTHAEGKNSRWSIIGAQDANDYYDFVSGNYEQLMKSFDWAWLQEHFNRLHSNTQ